jgi:hypothetical protein
MTYAGQMNSRTVTSSKKAIASAVLDDGTLVEAIYQPSTHQTALLSWRAGRLETFGSLNLPRLGAVIPYPPSNNLLTNGVVLLPSQATPYESPGALLASVRGFIHRYADLTAAFEEVASYYVLLTWIYDAFPVVPYLRLLGDWGSGKSRCLQTIGSICYKPIFTSGASTVSPLFRLIDSFRGTLILDESDFRFSDERAEIAKILNSGSASGFPVLRSEATPTKDFNPTAFDVFGPKIIATRRSFEDRALESRCITEQMSGAPPRADIPLNIPKQFHEEARELRNQLLMYRFLNRNAEPDLQNQRDARVEARVAQVFAPLLSVVQDESARERIAGIAQQKSAMLTSERSASMEAQLLDIIFQMRRDNVPLGVKDIAERFAEQFGPDYERTITPRWVGAQLRNKLSLLPVKSHGTFVIATPDSARLSALAERYGVEVAGSNDAEL